MDMNQLLAEIAKDESPSVLATVIEAVGHSYRKPGACMLLKLNGEQYGAISPGCLEHDLLERRDRVWASGQYEMAAYNMNADEDAVWGEAIGCGGEITVLLEPVAGELRKLLLQAASAAGRGSSVRLDRHWRESKIFYRLTAMGEDVSIDSMRENNEELAKFLTFSIIIEPRPRLVLFGAGKDAEAIYALARKAGFHVVVADWRPALCTQDKYPEATRVIGAPQEVAAKLGLHRDDYLIVCSHHLERDKEMLRISLPLSLVYIGVMGSKKRIRMLFETFLMPSNVRAPIGLPIGADGPFEIAVSVVAELIAIRAGKVGQPKKGAAANANFGYLFGGGTGLKDGAPQAGGGAEAGHAFRGHSASCASPMPT